MSVCIRGSTPPPPLGDNAHTCPVKAALPLPPTVREHTFLPSSFCSPGGAPMGTWNRNNIHGSLSGTPPIFSQEWTCCWIRCLLNACLWLQHARPVELAKAHPGWSGDFPCLFYDPLKWGEMAEPHAFTFVALIFYPLCPESAVALFCWP